MKIKPVRFHYNNLSGFDTNTEYIGIIAQDLQQVAPYMVSSTKLNGQQYLQVNNGAMTYMLINAMQEEEQKIAALTKEVEALKEMIKK
jgi:hypothetical protein